MSLIKGIPLAPTLEMLGVQSLAILSYITMNTVVGVFTIIATISTALLNYYRWRKESRTDTFQKPRKKDERIFNENPKAADEVNVSNN